MRSERAWTRVEGVVRHAHADVFLRIEQSGRNVVLRVIDGSGTQVDYTITRAPDGVAVYREGG